MTFGFPVATRFPAPPLPPLQAVSRIYSDGQVFRTYLNDEAWRYRCVSAFPLCSHFAAGHDIEPFLANFSALGYNTLRVFDYVTWSQTLNGLDGWDSPGAEAWLRFLDYVGQRGWYVELVVYTGDEPDRVQGGIQLIQQLATASPTNLLVEGANENGVNGKAISVEAQRQIEGYCDAARIPFAGSGTTGSKSLFGTYLTAHTGRDSEWPRKCHDLLEYYHGGGPDTPDDPAHHVPGLADEPIRPDQAGYVETDFYAYAAGCAILGGGCTFHFQGGKTGRLPTPREYDCAKAMAFGLHAFPADTPQGPYRRIDEHGQSLRTYVVGNCMVRIRPTTPVCPEPGWHSLDVYGICWTR